MNDIRWDSRLIGIRGARGVGETTLILQYMKQFLPKDLSALYVSLDNIRVNTGNLRETFFFNQLDYRHTVEYSEKGDFTVDKKYTFEIGGKGKNTRQIYSLKNAYIAADDIEYGAENKIPLWMFGFLY
jgi:hypothetical protein